MNRKKRKPKNNSARARTRDGAEFARIYPVIRNDIMAFCGWMNFTPTEQQAKVLRMVQMESQLPFDQRKKRIAIKSGQGPGKCLAPHMEVFDGITGKLMTVKEMADGGEALKVPSMDEETGRIELRAASAFPSGEKACVRVTLKNGSICEMTTDHPVYTSRGWVEAADLRKGDLVGVPDRAIVTSLDLKNRHVVWAPVTSVDHIGTSPVYDLEVPTTGNFVCSNMVVHNTTVSGIIMLWRCLQDVNAMGVVTAPTMNQIKNVWLAEARRLMQKAHPLLQKFIHVSKSRITIGGDSYPDWGVITLASSTPEQTQGMHEKNLTFIIEEASGVEDPIIEQIKGTLTNRNSLMIMIGNPNTRDNSFFDAFNRLRDQFHTFTMNAEESSIVDPTNIKRLEEEYGRDSDVFRVRVLGEFPLQNPNTVLSSDDLEACTRLSRRRCARGGGHIRQFGIDFSRFGGDEAVVYQRSGNAIIAQEIKVYAEPIEILRYAFAMARKSGWWKDPHTQWVVDAGGLGQGILHVLYEHGLTVHEFHSAGTPLDPQYKDQITEAFFGLRDLTRARAIYIPNDDLLIKQLCTRQYSHTLDGKLKVESKKEFVKRLGEKEGNGASPDRADALVMATYRAAVALGQVARSKRKGKRVGERTRR